jgi:hypothetical protein
MKKQTVKIQKTRKTSATCHDCGVVSREVNKSIKYNLSLCMTCLQERIISDLKD